MSALLRGITWEHDRGYGSVAASAREYSRSSPAVVVHWDFRSLSAFGDQPLEQLVEDYDLLVIDHPHVPRAAEAGLLLPLDGVGHDDELTVLASQSVGASHPSYHYRDHQWALAIDAAAQVAAWRPDLISAPPSSWDEVLELAAEGRVLWPLRPVDAFSSLLTIAANLGSPPMAQPGKFLSRDDARNVLDLMHRLRRLVPRDNTALNPIDVADQLASGDRFAYSPLLFGYSNYSRRGFRDRLLAYTDIPVGERGVIGSLLGGAGVAVSARTHHPEEALAYAYWLASSPVQQGVYFDGGGQPGNSAAWESDRLNDATLDFFRATRRTLDGAYVRPQHPAYPELQNSIGRHVSAALDGAMSDDRLIDLLNSETAKYLGGDHART